MLEMVVVGMEISTDGAITAKKNWKLLLDLLQTIFRICTERRGKNLVVSGLRFEQIVAFNEDVVRCMEVQ